MCSRDRGRKSVTELAVSAAKTGLVVMMIHSTRIGVVVSHCFDAMRVWVMRSAVGVNGSCLLPQRVCLGRRDTLTESRRRIVGQSHAKPQVNVRNCSQRIEKYDNFEILK